MRFNCNLALVRLLPFAGMILCNAVCMVFFAACSDDSEKRAQFQRLESILDSISVESDPNWDTRLDEAAQIKIEDPAILRIQQLCISAYTEYANALKEMKAGQKQVDALEKAVKSGDISNLAKQQAEAKEAILQTTLHLERSQAYIQRCMEKRFAMKKTLQVIGK